MKLAFTGNLSAFLIFCLILCFQPLVAQDDGNVVVNSNPQGALVSLDGLLRVSGVTPVKFDRLLSGQYKIMVEREGYEKHKSTVYFSESQPSQLDIKLVRKTPTKALFRSLIIPGWGQRYYGNRSKAMVITIGGLASVLGYIHYNNDFNDKVEIYNAARKSYDDATRWSELDQLNEVVQATQKDANDAEDKVNILIGITAGIYLFNLLDTFLFFPEHNAYAEYKAITAIPNIGDDSVGFTLAVRF